MEANAMEKIMLDVKDLQKTLGVGRDFAYELMRNKAFPSIRIGGRYFIEKDALVNWLRQYRGREFIL